MDNLPGENLPPKEKLSQISREEVDVINDIRGLNFGKVTVTIQDGVIISKEITKSVRVQRNNNGRNNNNGNKQGYPY